MTDTWEPTSEDVEWTKTHMMQVEVGGVWLIPSTQTIFRKESDTEVTMTLGDVNDNNTQRVLQCFAFAGVQVNVPDDIIWKRLCEAMERPDLIDDDRSRLSQGERRIGSLMTDVFDGVVEVNVEIGFRLTLFTIAE